MIIDFKFSPKQFVKITAYGLNCYGRVARCLYTPAGNQYDTEYALDGKIQVGPFYEDELEAVA